MTTIDETQPVSADDAVKPMRKDAARNRALLIAAAREVFAKRGLDASLDDIARQAGVGVGTAYRHFGNKHELAEAIMHQTIDEVVTAADRALEADDAWAGLVEFLESVLELQTKDRGLREVLMGVHEAKTAAVQERLTVRVRHLLERAQRDGQARADAESGDVGAVLMMLCHIADIGGDIEPTLWQRYVPTLLSALRPGGPPLPGRALTDAEMHEAIVCQHQGRPAARSAE